jgi:hypothetical protein
MHGKTIAAFLGALLLGMLNNQASAAAPDPRGIEFFEAKIRPVLINQCFECHSAKAAKLKGDLRLDTHESMLEGGKSGPAIVPGKPAESLLLQSLKRDKKQMPPEKPLPAEVIADFEKWIAMGAPDPRHGAAGYAKLTLEEAKNFWSLVPVRQPAAPKVADSAWPRTDVDRFILAGLEAKQLKPVGDTDRAILIRRLYFDIIGLPPTPEEVEAFVKESSAKPQAALEAVVDGLLASPRFGERWGRYWLDLARYAESNGNADNTPFPHAWRYRDYVIKSLNDDKPYDRFIREQIAGDLMTAKNAKQKDEHLIATGFLALTSKPRAQNNPDYKFDLIADQIDVTTRTVLGLSVMCARCHDHKFDPISTKEYYALAGIFESSQMLFGAAGRGAGKKGSGPAELYTLSNGSEAMGVREGKVKNSQVCIGGESRKLGETVPRGFIHVATPGTAPAIKSGSGRLELAEWLTARDNPLTARVAVNRIWLHLFGQGLVKSADNFGFLGERPSHPELLDSLAAQFMEQGWSVKSMIRSLVLSRTYQLASTLDESSFKSDPDNVLHWRMSQRRLDAEAFRDAILCVSGQLDLTPPDGSNAVGQAGKGKRGGAGSRDVKQRSVYLGIVRGAPLSESLSVFDVANPNIIVAQREETTVPAQALYLMNSPFILEQAKATAQRLLAQKNLDDAGRIDRAFRMVYARSATEHEKERALKYLTEMSKELGKPADAWASYCQVLIASAEFRYVR